MAFLISHFSLLTSVSQTLTGRAPSQVAVGEQFRLSYTVNTQDVKGFRAGNIPDGLEVLMGPSTSTQSSFQMINGRTSSTSSITYTYILSATKNGTFTISPARITADGKNIESNELRITVSGQAQGSQQGSHHGRGQEEMRPAGSPISGSDLFIRVSANKRKVREQEPILLTYKVYTQVDLTNLSGKVPDLKNFYTREIPLPQNKTYSVETLNGRPYRTVTWSQYVMFPQTSGKLEIPSIVFEGLVRQLNRDIDPFEAFFNGGSGYTDVKKKIKAPGITIEVDPLPKRPANFSGGVGSFTISAQLDKNEVKANDPVKLRVVVNGSGNMKLLKKPVVKFPKDFDTYDAKVTDKTQLTTNGLEGSITYEYLAVPRHQGDFDIPSIEYTYFDLNAGGYKTLHTDSFSIHVTRGSGSSTDVSSYSEQEDVKLLNSDIHYIKTGKSHQHAIDDFFFGSTAYKVSLAVLVLGFISLFIIFRQRAIENANVVKQRASKAGKVAAKRLKKANKLMKSGKEGEFYDEVLRTLWGFVGDRLNMPVEELSRENISQQLEARGINSEVTTLFLGALDECEFARYAPGDATGNMNKVYESALAAITRIAASLKKEKSKKSREAASSSTRLLLLTVTMLGGCLLSLPAQAQTKQEADSAYIQENYQKAARIYEELLKKGVSADIYYNLGNSYYRMNHITQAVLNYERALLLSPGDKDIRFNLQMARSKTIDKITPESEMFFVTWYRSLVNFMSVDGWARVALISLVTAIILALAYLFANAIWLRKVGFFGGGFFVMLFLAANLFAWQQKRVLVHRKGAIIIKSAVNVKSTPSKSGTDLFLLHEGTKVMITDSSMKSWRAIRVADGKEGWVEVSQIEVI
jgi:tetratricopeptide (TPR) repeat protein